MNTQEIPGDNEVWTEHWQVTEEGDFQYFLTTTRVDEITKLPLRATPKQIILEFDDEGWLVAINNNFKQMVLDGAGKPLRGHDVSQPHSFNILDRRFFSKHFAPQFRPNITNGYFRGPLEFNQYPPYDPYGNLINYPGPRVKTANYSTHDADGTPINPVAEQPDENNEAWPSA